MRTWASWAAAPGAYHAEVHDGTQWVLWIKQADQEKSIYFNNHFPDEIVRFAEQLDAVLSECDLENMNWKTVPATESRQHERELWEAVKKGKE